MFGRAQRRRSSVSHPRLRCPCLPSHAPSPPFSFRRFKLSCLAGGERFACRQTRSRADMKRWKRTPPPHAPSCVDALSRARRWTQTSATTTTRQTSTAVSARTPCAAREPPPAPGRRTSPEEWFTKCRSPPPAAAPPRAGGAAVCTEGLNPLRDRRAHIDGGVRCRWRRRDPLRSRPRRGEQMHAGARAQRRLGPRRRPALRHAGDARAQ